MVAANDIGYWRLILKASEVQNGSTYTYEKDFYIRVEARPKEEEEFIVVPYDSEGVPLEGYLVKESLIRQEDVGRPLPFAESFDSKGLMTIGWLEKLVPPSDFAKIVNSTLVVTGDP